MSFTRFQGVGGHYQRQMLNATIQGACAYHTGARNPFPARTDPELHAEFERAKAEQAEIVAANA